MPLHRGKLASNPEILETRPLTREDLAILDQSRGASPTRSGSGVVQKLRDPHHRLARLIAAGLRGGELTMRSGYSQARIGTLMQNAAFVELVASYREKVTEAFVEEQEAFIELATSNMITAERMLAEKLEIAEEEGTLPSIRELMSIRSDSADRLGYGKKNMTINAKVDFAATMEAVYERTRKAREIGASTPMIEARVVPASSPPLAPSDPAAPKPTAAPFQRRA
jgi:hypothetical protein